MAGRARWRAAISTLHPTPRLRDGGFQPQHVKSGMACVTVTEGGVQT